MSGMGTKGKALLPQVLFPHFNSQRSKEGEQDGEMMLTVFTHFPEHYTRFSGGS